MRGADEARLLVLVCHGPSCSERGSAHTCARLRELVASSSARRAIRVCETSCLDNCATGPNVLLADEAAILTGRLPETAEELCDWLVARVAATS